MPLFVPILVLILPDLFQELVDRASRRVESFAFSFRLRVLLNFLSTDSLEINGMRTS